MNEIDVLLERMKQRRQASAVSFVADRRGNLCAESRMGCTHLAGDRVFDTVSGMEGTVVSSTIENIVISATRR